MTRIGHRRRLIQTAQISISMPWLPTKYSFQFLSYKPGKAGEAYGIINDHFAPAGAAAGLPGPVVIHFQSGAWDASFHWRLEDGLADLEWRRSPNDVAFRAALVAQEGSEDAADEIFDRYNSLIARTSTVIGHRHVSEDEE